MGTEGKDIILVLDDDEAVRELLKFFWSLRDMRCAPAPPAANC